MKRLAIIALVAALATPAIADSQDLVNGLKKQFARPAGSTAAAPSLFTPLGGVSGINSQLTTVFDALANWVGGDLTAAETLAIGNANLQDWTGYACWKAAENFSAVLQAHPVPLTLKAATDAQALRLAIAAASQLCHTNACQTLSGDLNQGIAQLGIGIPAPATLETICAKIPTITLGTQPAGFVAPAPTPTPSPAPIPSATPTPSPSASP